MSKEKGNEVVVRNELNIAQESFIKEIEQYSEVVGLDFTDEEKRRIGNAIRVIDPILKDAGLTWNHLDRKNVQNVLQQVAFLKVNPSAIPRECYFILRNKNLGKDAQGKTVWGKDLEFGIEGAGNDVILRKFGVDVEEVRSYIVREGDDFTGAVMDGWDYKLPQWTPRYRSNKAKMAVYLIKHKSTGEIEVSIAHREDVKQSLFAHMRQNGVSEEELRELGSVSLDDLLTTPKYRDMTVKRTKWIKNQQGKNVEQEYDAPAIGLAWISEVSREAVIERKLRNLATRRLPKDFSHGSIKEMYEETFEDEKYNRQGSPVINHEDVLMLDENDFDENANKEVLEPQKKSTPPKKQEPKGEKLEVKYEENTGEIYEELENIDDETVEQDDVVEEESEVEEKVVEKKTSVQRARDNDDEVPDFLK